MIQRRALGLLGVAALAGCGFELRRAPELRFRSIALAGFAPKSLLAEELRTTLAASPTTTVVDAAPQAQVVLEALADGREKSVVASTASSRATSRSRSDCAGASFPPSGIVCCTNPPRNPLGASRG